MMEQPEPMDGLATAKTAHSASSLASIYTGKFDETNFGRVSVNLS
jgi:hypothetical protein